MEIVLTNEIEKCLKIRYDVFVLEQKVPIELEIDSYDTPGNEVDHFLILEGTNEIGTLRCLYEPNNVVHLQRFAIEIEYRGRHYGADTIAYISNYYKNMGIKKIVLDAQTYAIPFYEKCGFEVISSEFMDAGIPHKKMEKLL